MTYTTKALLSLVAGLLLVPCAWMRAADAQTYVEDFELGHFAPFWSEVVGNTSINSDRSFVHSGTYSARISYLGNETRGELFLPSFSTDHVYLRWYDYFAGGFDFPLNLKMSFLSSPGAYDVYVITWGDPMNDSPGERAEALGFVQARAVDKRTDSGARPETGRWYCLEQEIILNTPGRQDGVMRFWVDGALLINNTAADVRGSSSSPLSSGWLGGNYSNSNGGTNPTPDPARPSYRYLDDVVISLDGTRAHCLESAPGSNQAPPSPPKRLTIR